MFKLISKFKPRGDQNKSIKTITNNILNNKNKNILYGSTGTGKTFTVANIIEKLNKNTLIICHNKTLSMQLYSELKTFFPKNKVKYFISPFDFYRPESYLPNNDIYIDKSVKWNFDIKEMRLNALNALSSNESTIIVSSVASIFGVTNPFEYKSFIFSLKKNQKITKDELLSKLIKSGYKRNDYILEFSNFMVKGNFITINNSDENKILQINLLNSKIIWIKELDSLNFKILKEYDEYKIFPGMEYIVENKTIKETLSLIKNELIERINFFKKNNKLVEAYRIEKRVLNDLEMMKEINTCKGIENYSMYFDKRKINDEPYTLLDFFGDDFLLIIDESHITIPQIKGMYFANYSRKKNLIDYGFRLESAFANRPLNFDEFENRMKKVIFLSATPGDYEMNLKDVQVVKQIIRPTGLLDPEIFCKSTKNQFDDLKKEIKETIKKNGRVFVLTLTIKMAEDLTKHLQENNFKVAYIHSNLKTFERVKTLINLRKGIFDVVVGINLLREGLDIPEIMLVAILDADKIGFLRSRRSLIQIVGRASRNKDGKVIMYFDKLTKDIKETINETNERRKIQIKYNKEYNIIPKTIQKPIEDIFLEDDIKNLYTKIETKKTKKITKEEIEKTIKLLNKKMNKAVKKMDFELAAKIRDIIFELKFKK